MPPAAWRHPARTRAAALALFLAGAVLPTGLRAQGGGPVEPGPVPGVGADEWATPRWVGHAGFLATNAAVAGLTAGVLQHLRGGDFGPAFVRGAAGGAVAYAGRRVAAERFDGAGLLGRQVSAVGVSMARNAGEGRPALERLLFPLGPIHLYVDRADGPVVRPRLHVLGLGQAVWLALQEEATFDGRASLSAGAPVFRSPGRTLRIGDQGASGLALHGTIILGDADWVEPARLFAHERVHILQWDFAFHAWSQPAEQWLLDRSRYTATVSRYLDFGGLVPLLGMGAVHLFDVDYYDWPHELEARFLGRT